MELELTETPPAEELLARLPPQAPAGTALRVGGGPAARAAARPGPAAPPTRCRLPPSRLPGLDERIQRLLAAIHLADPAPDRAAPIDLRAVAPCAGACGEGASADAAEDRPRRQRRTARRVGRTGPGGPRAPRRPLSPAPTWRSIHDGLASSAPPPPPACLLECPLVGLAEQESETMKQEMLINVSQPEECRIAIVEDGALEELYVERTGQDSYVGNIYKGVVVNLEPSIQAAFVDFGVGRNGFLHISDVEPQYFRQGGYDPDKPHRASGRPRATAAAAAAAKPTTDGGRRGRTTNRLRRRHPRRGGPSAPAAAPASSRPSRRSSAAATKSSCRSSRKGSAPRDRRSRPTSASPAATWCSCRPWAASASRGRSRTKTSAAASATSCSS